MPKREYSWESIDSPPEIGRHSLNKHEVLQSYLQRYLNKFYGKAREYVRFSIIDGFSGGGIYRRPDDGKIHYGSPILIMNTVAEEQLKLAEAHGKQVELRARYYFIEKKKRYFSLLKEVLADCGLNSVVDGIGGCIHGEFVKLCPQVIDSIKAEGRTHKAIFTLDQFGYAAVPLQTIQYIFKELPDAEIIRTFAADWLIDYLTEKEEHIAKCQQRLDDLGIGLEVRDLVNIKHSTPHFRLLIQYLLSEELSKNCGARFFTRYFIQTEEKKGKQSHRSIWLVHMSQHEIARDEMVKVHWETANHISTHAGFQGIDDAGFRGLGYTTHQDDRLGQLNLEYNFDTVAEDTSINTLLNQIPHLIWKKEVLTFAELMGEIANYTPVSSSIIRKVLNVLLTNNDIQIIAENGTVRQKGNAIK